MAFFELSLQETLNGKRFIVYLSGCSAPDVIVGITVKPLQNETWEVYFRVYYRLKSNYDCFQPTLV